MKVALNKNIKVFVIYINSLVGRITIYLAKKAPKSFLFVKKVTFAVEYWDFANISSKKITKILLKYNKANKYTEK